MKNGLINEEIDTLVRYYLGELSGDALERVDERLFLNDDYSELGEEVERTLVDAYAENTLSQQQKAHFETRYLTTPERQKALETAYLLKLYRSHGGKGDSDESPRTVEPWVCRLKPSKDRSRE